MGALADDEGHFLRWLQQADKTVTGNAFVPRKLYGDYLESLLDEVSSPARDVELLRHAGDVTDVAPSDGRVRLTLRDGTVLEADRVVLALGNLPPRDWLESSGAALGSRYARDAWAPGTLAQLPRTKLPILLIGSGLTDPASRHHGTADSGCRDTTGDSHGPSDTHVGPDRGRLSRPARLDRVRAFRCQAGRLERRRLQLRQPHDLDGPCGRL